MKTESVENCGRRGENGMGMQEKEKQNSAEHTLLEVPEVVPGVMAVDFPEINEFLQGMKLKGSLLGFQREDV